MEVIFFDSVQGLNIPEDVRLSFSEGLGEIIHLAQTYVVDDLGLRPKAEQLVIDLADPNGFTGETSFGGQSFSIAYAESSLSSGDPSQVTFDSDGFVSPFPVVAHELVHSAEEGSDDATLIDDIMDEGLAHVATFKPWVMTGAVDMAKRLQEGIVEGLGDPEVLLNKFLRLVDSLDIENLSDEDAVLAFGHRSPGVKVGMAATVVALYRYKSWKDVFALSSDGKLDLLM